MFTILSVALLFGEQSLALQVGGAAPLSRRAVVQTSFAAAASTMLPVPAAHAAETKEAKQVKDTVKALKELVASKDAFISGVVAQDAAAPQLPTQIPFAVFQKLEGTSDPEFMEAAIDYAEATRAAKDLLKLAKLTKQKVQISTKVAGKPREYSEVEYGAAPGANLGTAQEYAERAAAEVLGSSLALEAAAKAMGP